MSHLFTYSFATQTLSTADSLLSAGETVMNMRGANSALLELVFCQDRHLTTIIHSITILESATKEKCRRIREYITAG